MVRVGEVLRLERRAVQIDPTREYRLLGVYSWGKGAFLRHPQTGAELRDYRFFSIEPGDLILSNIQAWEGAIAHSGRTEVGAVGTHRFLTYVSRDGRIDTNWARWFFLSEPGMELIRQAAPGTTMRNRTLAIQRFESLEIPLLPIEEQTAIAAHLSGVHSIGTTLSSRLQESEKLSYLSFASSLAELILNDRWPRVPLSSIADVNPKPTRMPDNEIITFVPMSAVDANRGTLRDVETRMINSLSSGYKQFTQGDVIFARITPSMQNGKCAVFRGPTSYGYGSTEFHVVRPGIDVLPEWIHEVMRTAPFRAQAAKRFKGTAGQQRVPADFLNEVMVPVPNQATQVLTLKKAARMHALYAKAAALFGHRRAMVKALRPAALNEAFGGLS